MWNQKELGGSREGGCISDTSTLIDGSEAPPRTNTSTTTVEEVGTVAVKTGLISILPAAPPLLPVSDYVPHCLP